MPILRAGAVVFGLPAGIPFAIRVYTCRTREGDPTLCTDLEETQRELTLDAEGRFAEDLPCRACGYNLRGQVRDAVCPECSAPVSLSARSDLLRFSDPDWIERLARGMRLILIGLLAATVLQITIAVVSIAMTTSGTPVVTGLLATAGLLGAAFSVVVVVVVGVWWLTTPDPARAERERTLSVRRLTRWCLLAQIAAAPLQVASPAGGVGAAGAGPPFGIAFVSLATAGFLVSFIVLVGYTAGFVYLRRLAQRVPRPSVARQTRIVMWGYLFSQGLGIVVGMLSLFVFTPAILSGAAGPTVPMIGILIGGCVVAAGALVFGIWGLVLLFMYAALFKRTASEARAAWAQ
jgi:hypothetical protein